MLIIRLIEGGALIKVRKSQDSSEYHQSLIDITPQMSSKNYRIF